MQLSKQTNQPKTVTVSSSVPQIESFQTPFVDNTPTEILDVRLASFLNKANSSISPSRRKKRDDKTFIRSDNNVFKHQDTFQTYMNTLDLNLFKFKAIYVYLMRFSAVFYNFRVGSTLDDMSEQAIEEILLSFKKTVHKMNQDLNPRTTDRIVSFVQYYMDICPVCHSLTCVCKAPSFELTKLLTDAPFSIFGEGGGQNLFEILFDGKACTTPAYNLAYGKAVAHIFDLGISDADLMATNWEDPTHPTLVIMASRQAIYNEFITLIDPLYLELVNNQIQFASQNPIVHETLDDGYESDVVVPQMGFFPDINVNHSINFRDFQLPQQFEHILNNVQQATATTSNIATSISDSTNNVISGVTGTLKTMLPLIAVIALVYLCTSDARTSVSNRQMAAGIVCYLLASELTSFSFKLTPLLGRLATLLDTDPVPDPDIVVPQVGMESIIDIVGLIYSAIILRYFPLKSPKNLMDSVTSFWKAKPALEDIFLKSFEFIQGIVNTFIKDHTNYKPLRFFSANEPRINELFKTIDELTEEFNSHTLPATASNLGRTKSLLLRVTGMYREMKSSDSNARLLWSEIVKLQGIVSHIQSRNVSIMGSRQEPVVLLLVGSAGVGKSIAAEYIARDLSTIDATPREMEVIQGNPSEYVFVYAPEIVHMDGYRQDNKVLVCDEFMQIRDSIGTSNPEIMNFIRVGSGFPMPLPMAHLHEKGAVNMISKFCILTSNDMNMHFESICAPEAVRRRFQFPYMVIPKPKYCKNPDAPHRNQVFDVDKLPTGTFKIDGITRDVTILSPDVQLFIKVDFSCHPSQLDLSVPALTYQQLMSKIKEAYELRKFWRAAQLSELNRPDREIFYDAEDTVIPQSGEDEVYRGSDEALALFERIFHPSLSDELRTEYFIRLTGVANCLDQDCVDASILFMIDTLINHYGLDETENRILYATETFWQSDENFKPPNRNLITARVSDFALGLYQEALKFSNDFIVAPMARQLAEFMHNPEYVHERATVRMIFSFVLTVQAIRFMTGKKKKKTKSSVEPQSFNLGDKMARNKSVNKWTNDQDFKGLKPQMGCSADKGGYDRMLKIFNNNVWTMKVESLEFPGEFVKWGLVTFVKGRLALMPYHFVTKVGFYMLNEGALAMVNFSRAEKPNINYSFPMQDLYAELERVGMSVLDDIRSSSVRINNGDLALVRIPYGQPAADIISVFGKLDQSEFIRTNLHFNLWGSHEGRRETLTGYATAIDEPRLVSPDWCDNFYLRQGYKYPNETNLGDCGSLFVIVNSARAEKIFGVHVAGGGSEPHGYAQSVCQEDIYSKMSELYEDVVIDVVLPDMVLPQNGTFVTESNCLTIAQLPPNMIPTRVFYTDIRKSLLYNMVSPTQQAPASLKVHYVDEVKIDPWEKGLMKICQNSLYIPPQIVADAANSLECKILAGVHKIKPFLLTVRECLFGVLEVPGMRGVTRSSSAGFPYTIPGQRNFKKEIFSFPDGSKAQDKIIAEFEEVIADHILDLRKGRRPFFTNVAHLKDERRPIGKSARLFSAGPFELLILNMMYYGSFVAFFMANRITNGSAVGVNQYSREWDVIARELLKFGNVTNIGAGDYSGFDGSQLPVIHNAIHGIIKRWYKDGNDAIRDLLFLEVTNSRMIVHEFIVEWDGSLPSGHYLTIVINTLYSLMNFRMSWMILQLPIDLYNDNVVDIAVGDDNVFAVNPKYAETFNEMTLQAPMAALGMNYTTELKGVATVPLRELGDVEFLKRKWSRDEVLGIYVAPIRMEVILDMLNWTKRTKSSVTSEQITIDNVVISLNELSLHTRAAYFEWYPKILDAIEKKLPNAVYSRSPHMSYDMRRGLVLNDESIIC